MKSLTVKSGLLSALSTLVNREFTVHDLTEAYLNDPACLHGSKKAARQFVYRNMLRLINTEELTRVVVESGWPLYRLTPRFRVSGGTPVITVAPLATHDKATAPKDNPRQSLQARLNRHKLEMLSAMGETEEYDSICSEMPELRDDVQPLYNQSRDKCSKLLGRVKALESLLARETGLAQ
ncbi:hypothetical protein [Cellvibrio sp. KY-YJ-3]|uniref:hypothetical protein n=1 Tax=Cellvibrio sp. KY-YJ-3 TaxID=454662 RepID=UPI00178197F3|nr:hypothetical protein [Cellvibrio sp. KY-YJ-3]